ncbi:CGNR zinc finger domain-containing protein [Bacillus horti]|nr:CGNR zinc finger domain-containing protein [Bacillus horti]
MTWLTFINSFWTDWRGRDKGRDRLEEEEWFRTFLEKGNIKLNEPYTSELVEDLKHVRHEMSEVVRRLVNEELIRKEDMLKMNQWLAQGTYIRQIEQKENQFELITLPLDSSLAQLKAQIIASFVEALVEGQYKRIKICDNPDCRWVYYDTTKNRSKRFCDDKTCGNLMKVRRHRAQKKASDL